MIVQSQPLQTKILGSTPGGIWVELTCVAIMSMNTCLRVRGGKALKAKRKEDLISYPWSHGEMHTNIEVVN